MQRLFEDKADAPYSIHNIASRGTVVKKAVGDWFGPNAMAQVLKYCSHAPTSLLTYEHRSLTTDQGEECDITVHVAMDSTICLEDIGKHSTSSQISHWPSPSPCLTSCVFRRFAREWMEATSAFNSTSSRLERIPEAVHRTLQSSTTSLIHC